MQAENWSGPGQNGNNTQFFHQSKLFVSPKKIFSPDMYCKVSEAPPNFVFTENKQIHPNNLCVEIAR